MLLLLVLASLFYFKSGYVFSVTTLSDTELEQFKRDAAQQLAHGNEGHARQLLKPYLEHRPDDAEAHLLLAKSYLTQDRYEECYTHLTECLRLKTDREETQFLAGVVAEQIGKTEAAAAHFQHAATMAPDNAKYAIYLGNAQLRLGRVDLATLHAQRAGELDASLSEVHALLAKIAEYQGRIPQALDHNTRALELIENDEDKLVTFTVYHAQLLRKADRPRDAIALLFSLDPELQQQDRVAEQAAEAYLVLDQPMKAAAVWAELFTLDPAHARAAAEAGLCLLKAGQPRDAHHYLGLAERIAPQHPAVLKLKAALVSRPDDAAGDNR